MPLSRIEREAQALSLGHGSASKDREIDAMLSQRLESLPHMQLKDEIKKMIPVRGMGIIDRKLKAFISRDDKSSRKIIPPGL